MQTISRLVVLSILLSTIPSVSAQRNQVVFDAASGVQVGSAEELITKWNPNQHLYLKGDLGIGADQIRNLEKWLDENGPHWTVFLMRNAHDEVYRSLENRVYRGMDAVEVAMGRGLSNRTSFGELEDPRTGETDGAIFVLFLEERKFSYFSSDAQDRRSLGKSHWIGKLDRPAFRAMRGGGRILDAVKGTVSNINDSLTRAIVAEAAEQARVERERKRSVAQLNSQLEEARQRIQQTVASAAAMKSQYPDAAGELATPPTADWEQRLNVIKADLNESNVRASAKAFSTLSNEIEGYLNAYAQHQALGEQLAPLESRANELRTQLEGYGIPFVDEALQHMNEGKSARERGERGLAKYVADANAALDHAEKAIAEEQTRRRRAAVRRNLIWTTIFITAAVLMIGFLVLLYMLYRRRMPAFENAAKTFTEREKTVKAEMDKVYGLFERSREVLGSKEKVQKRGYEGETKKLTDHTFEDVDDLFVMSNEVERVMQEAREMIYPKNPASKIKNMFSSVEYERGINRISGEPLEFHRDKGLPLVIERESERTGTELPEKISMTFDKVFEAFHDRSAAAAQNLDTIETSLMELDGQLSKLQEQIETATTVDRELLEAAEDDGMFLTPAFFETLLPSAQSDFDEADKISTTDPVQAMQNQVPRGVRKLLEGLTVAKSLKRGREQVFPKLNDCAPQLKDLGYDTAWIQEEVAKLGDQANGLFTRAAQESIADEAEQFSNDVTGLGDRALRSVELAMKLKDETWPAILAFEKNIGEARSRIARDLGLPLEHCLCEHEANPDVNLNSARQLFEAARAALQHGRVEAAAEAVQAIENQVATGQGFIDASLEFLGTYESTLHALRSQHEDVKVKLPRHDELLNEARGKYAESALVLQASDPSFADPSATVASHLNEVRERLDDAASSLDQAAEKHRRGALLFASRMLDSADSQSQMADELLREIDEHCTRLDARIRDNVGELNAMERKTRALNAQVNDPRTQQATITEYERVLREIELAQREISTNFPRDPFKDAAAIGTFAENVNIVEAKIASDAEAFAETRRSVEGAFAELRVAQELVNRARTDNIPDSPQTTSSVRVIGQLESACGEVRRMLDVPHGDWKRVGQESAHLTAKLGVESAKLRGELQRAQRSVDLFELASAAVFEATRWTGGLGVRVFGAPGSQELERARRALNQGDYSVMLELARAAQVAAQHAIQQAQREVYRQQREAERKEEEARRRRRQRQISIGGSSFPSFPSGGGSSSSSSRSSSSGGSPSGSGFSRSGW